MLFQSDQPAAAPAAAVVSEVVANSRRSTQFLFVATDSSFSFSTACAYSFICRVGLKSSLPITC